ncbi:hypothetical protein N836_35795 [Leptolyngbya sp. Heron Island J]|uniref:hypothetical protein n=1 Tax=Leptolyngbya sp. Heron Island J TaxID=1385935 RepID=UPI0003B9ABF2|nr:hypothetical protein [Leptolyngbya sp. Heron Island J]ESA37738.1 hypothetical protein N836_35795 [Leptolyngbya sp. Heron Island J]
MIVNLSDRVWVRLTPQGLQHLRQYYNDPSYMPDTDKQGWSSWQLWVLIGLFGELCKLPSARIQPFVNNEIRLSD